MSDGSVTPSATPVPISGRSNPFDVSGVSSVFWQFVLGLVFALCCLSIILIALRRLWLGAEGLTLTGNELIEAVAAIGIIIMSFLFISYLVSIYLGL